jgi:hypothetical protein
LPGPSGPSHNRCPAVDLTDLTLTGRAYSRGWLRGSTLISSSAEVYATTADANAWWRRQTSAAGRACAVNETERSFSARVSLRQLPLPRLAPKNILWRLTIGENYFDILILQRGRAHVFAAILSRTTPNRADELRLGRLLAARLARATRS